MIALRQQLSVLSGGRFMLHLRLRRLYMSLLGSPPFCSSGGAADATLAAVITHMVHGRVVYNDRSVLINVGYVSIVHVHCGAVVVELPAAPFAASKSLTTVAKAVIHAAVEADMWPPITRVPAIVSIAPPPVAGRPEIANRWCRNPGSRNPVITLIPPSPIARSPHVAFLRANRLNVYGQRGRCHRDRNKDARKRCGWYSQHQQCENQQTGETNTSHAWHFLPFIVGGIDILSLTRLPQGSCSSLTS